MGPSASPNQAPDDGTPTDGVKEVAEATLPGAPARSENKEQREGSIKKKENKSPSKEEPMPIMRKESRRHVGETAHLDDFKEPGDGTEHKADTPFQKQGIKLNQIIAYETKAAYRARALRRAEEKPPSIDERGRGDSPGVGVSKGYIVA